MTHGTRIRKRRPAAAIMASARNALCRLQTTHPWFWLDRTPVFEAASTRRAATAFRVVLLHGLPGFLVSLGKGGLGHG